ncbi:LuxR C-terminal-related transcriptional regulator [Streptomyces sp. NPDC091377]|uniref:ATP-binding protein n=1 Tax=Streptomyces sp. NPDC091377 TaxID=3365995 RepID=UPI00381A8832
MGGSAPRRDGRPPVETTSFVDRRGEQNEGRELLARARLVTLTGPGGVGKTRLAGRIAARVERAFPDGVRFVHLSGLRDPDLVPLAAADALGLHDHSTQPVLDALVEQVRERRLLLVVDNCEHLSDACARLTAALLHGTTGVRVLATSRHRLGLTEEHLLEVRPLPVPGPDDDLAAHPGPALTLFADRAAAVVPGFRLTAANRAAVARLCRRLDGLPLAIELAAVRMRVLGVEQLIDRLDDRYRLLTTGSPTVLPRHQTLGAAVDWSHELCTEQEQSVWARAGVLAGSFDLETAEAVCADGERVRPHDVLEAVAGLVDKSVLCREPEPPASDADRTDTPRDTPRRTPPTTPRAAPDPRAPDPRAPDPRAPDPRAPDPRDFDPRDSGPPAPDPDPRAPDPRHPSDDGVRYRLLDTLRHYGLEKLRSRPGEEAAARRRHLAWIQRRATEYERTWFGPGQRRTVARLRADQDNLRAALDFALTTPGEAPRALRLAGTLWFYWHACGAPREGRHWLDRALDANPAPTRDRARALWTSALLAGCPEDLTRGRDRAEQARDLALSLGDPAEAAHAEHVVGVIRLFSDDLPGALDHFRATVARGRVPGQDLGLHGLDRVELACALALLGDPDRSIEVSEETRRLCERHGDEWVLSYVLRMLALAHTLKDDLPRAERHAREALDLKRAVHDVVGIGLTLDLLARIAALRGAYERAAVLLGGADRVWADVDRHRWGSAALNSARAHTEELTSRTMGAERYRKAYDHGGSLGLAEIVGHALDERRPPPARTVTAPAAAPLTRRENEVAHLVAEGLANQQIADRLVIARRTAEGHVERILTKLGFTSRSQIAAWVTARR